MAPSPAGVSLRLLVTLLFLCATASGPSAFHASQANPQTPPASARKGAISGVVTDGATGRPIPGALVSLSDSKTQVSLGTVADSKGRFVFTDLPTSQGYTFRVQKSGYYSLGVGQNAGFMFGVPVRIPLSEKEWRQHLDVVLWPFGTIGGRVVDEQGEPVVGVPVHVLTRIAAGGSEQWVVGPTGTTDDRGSYRIDELRQGTYLVHVPNVQSSVPLTASPAQLAGIRPEQVNIVAPSPTFGLPFVGGWLVLGQYAIPPPIEGVYRAYPPLYYSSSRSFAGATPVDLMNGEDKVGIDFVLQPVPTASVSGRVVGPPDAFGGLVVRLFPAESPMENGNSEIGTALVAVNGTFTIVGVPAGSYTLSTARFVRGLRLIGAAGDQRIPGIVPPPSFGMLFSPPGFSAVDAAGGSPYFGTTSVAVSAAGVTDVVVELHAGATISGRVVNEDGAPLRDVINVSVSGTGEPTFMAAHIDVTPEAGSAKARNPDPAAAPGHFVLRGLLEGNYRLNASFGSLVVKSIVGPGGDYTDRPFQAIPATEISDVVVTLTDHPATLRGVVRDRDGMLSPFCAVIVFPADRSRWRHFGLNPSDITSVAALGGQGYSVSRMRAGSYLVVATAVSQSAAWQDSRFLEAAAAVATPVTLTWGASTVLDLTLKPVTVK